MGTENLSAHISFKYPETQEDEGITCHKNLKESIEAFLKSIKERTGVRFSKSAFVVKALQFYVKHLMKLESEGNLLSELSKEPQSLGDDKRETANPDGAV